MWRPLIRQRQFLHRQRLSPPGAWWRQKGGKAMGEPETPAQFRERMRSLQIIKGGRTRPLEKIITRPDRDKNGNQIDAGKRAKVTINEERDIILTTSDNRQDANIIGTPAVAGGIGGEGGD